MLSGSCTILSYTDIAVSSPIESSHFAQGCNSSFCFSTNQFVEDVLFTYFDVDVVLGNTSIHNYTLL
jgi:hypothetical protein